MLKSKTFKFVLIILAISTIMLLLGKLTGDTWAGLMEWLGGYATLRGTTEMIKRKRGAIDEALRSSSDDDLAQRIVQRTER